MEIMVFNVFMIIYGIPRSMIYIYITHVFPMFSQEIMRVIRILRAIKVVRLVGAVRFTQDLQHFGVWRMAMEDSRMAIHGTMVRNW
jgi:hypothetical protein